MLTCPATISLSSSTLTYLSRLLADHRKAIRSPWRRLPPSRQALLVLAHLRNGDTYQRLAAGFGIGVATVYRYIREAVDLLAARAPSLTAALWVLAWTVNTFAILDGTVVRTDRLGGANNRLYYSGKHRHHGVNLQGLTDPYGRLIWISEGLPGSTHDLTAAHHHQIFPTINRADLHLFAEGYLGGESTLLLLPYKAAGYPTATATPTALTPPPAPAASNTSPPSNTGKSSPASAPAPAASAPSPKPSSPSNNKDEKGSMRVGFAPA